MLHINKCGCIVEKTDEPVEKEGGVRESTKQPYMVVKYKKCKKCHSYEALRNQFIPSAIIAADRQVPEIRTSKPSTREREVASGKWNLVFHSTMDSLCRDHLT